MGVTFLQWIYLCMYSLSSFIPSTFNISDFLIIIIILIVTFMIIMIIITTGIAIIIIVIIAIIKSFASEPKLLRTETIQQPTATWTALELRNILSRLTSSLRKSPPPGPSHCVAESYLKTNSNTNQL